MAQIKNIQVSIKDLQDQRKKKFETLKLKAQKLSNKKKMLLINT
jgi:hypothetical protein